MNSLTRTSQKVRALAPDLTRTSPRSPYAPLDETFTVCGARLLDKCRAELAGQIGSYRYNCPMDRKFFAAAGLDAAELREFVGTGANDHEVAAWMKTRATEPLENIRRWCRRFRANPIWHLLELEDWLHRRRNRERPTQIRRTA